MIMTDDAINTIVAKYVGVPFKHNGRELDDGLDCLGLIYCLYKDLGIDFPSDDGEPIAEDWHKTDPERYVRNLLILGKPVDIPQRLDLVYFYMKGAVRHAGIMVDDNRFIHTLTNRNSRITRLAKYWSYALAGVRRMI